MFLFRGEQRAAMKKARAVLNKLDKWDIARGSLSPRSRLSRTALLPDAGDPSVLAYANALYDLLGAQLARTATLGQVPNP